jgi:hypothetical protein
MLFEIDNPACRFEPGGQGWSLCPPGMSPPRYRWPRENDWHYMIDIVSGNYVSRLQFSDLDHESLEQDIEKHREVVDILQRPLWPSGGKP